MKFKIEHRIKGRIRIHIIQNKMTARQADILEYYLEDRDYIKSAKVTVRTQDAVICYTGDEETVINELKHLSYENANVPDSCIQNTGRELNDMYWEKLVTKVFLRYTTKIFVPFPIRKVITGVKSVKYIWHGVSTLAKGKIEVPVLDATAIGVSIIRGDFNTAGSVMFLLGVGEILEEWTHKKSVDDLARSMSLNIGKVWLRTEAGEVQVNSHMVKAGDEVVVHMGNVIPFDGEIVSGEAMINQSTLTGEPLPVRKKTDDFVYAGTVVEEGEVSIRVKNVGGDGRYEKIVAMIEESEKLKSSVEGKASHLADRLVPYTLAGAGLTYLFTRNVTKAISVLMVDFSCALKLAMPISVLSAIQEASRYSITVKGGKYMEAVSEAKTIVFDKTGTLTRATPVVKDVVSFCNETPDELLRIAACLEEHFPHSMAKAVVDAAKDRNLGHDEMHTKVEYVVAHGISTTINGKRAVIGSYHFVFEDEKCIVSEDRREAFMMLPKEYSHLYLAIDGMLSAVICIEDPLREESCEVVAALRKCGFEKIVMMTGDSEKTARAIAARVGVDEYYSEVLPEDKARFVEKEKKNGNKVIMIGDGVNDSPALSAADVGIAIRDGAQIACEVADITIDARSLYEIVKLKEISNLLMKRIHNNYRVIVSFNMGLIILGICGVLAPTTSAMLHNTSTLIIGLESMKPLLDKE